MVIYTCNSCDYSTKRKAEYKRHLETKKHIVSSKSHHFDTPNSPFCHQFDTILTPQKDTRYPCKYCNKLFKYRQGMYRHIKYTCKKNKDEDFKELARLMNEKDKQIMEKDSRLDKMQKQIDKLANKLQIQNINHGMIQNNNNHNNVVIQLLNHKDTDYSHLTHKDYMACINDCNKCVKTLVEKVHFNKNKPENHNIYLSNIKGKYVMIFKENEWQIRDKREQIDDLYDYNEMVLDMWYDEYKERYPNIIRSFQRYLTNKDENDILNKVKDEILEMLYNKRKMISTEIKLCSQPNDTAC